MRDVNGTRFHLIFGHKDWESHLTHTRRFTPAAQLQLPKIDVGEGVTLQPRPFRFPKRASGVSSPPRTTTLDPRTRRLGADLDQYGNWYWIASDQQRIEVLSVGSQIVSNFWEFSTGKPGESEPGSFKPKRPSPPLEPLVFRGLTITAHHYLVVGVLSPDPGLLIFDLHAGSQPVFMVWPDLSDQSAEPFAPFDLAGGEDCSLWILESHSEPRFWHLDDRFQFVDRHDSVSPPGETILVEDFQPKDQSASTPFVTIKMAPPVPFSLDLASPLDGLAAADPISIEGLPDGTALIMFNGSSPFDVQVRRFRGSEPLPFRLPDASPPESRDHYNLESDRFQIDPEGVLELWGYDIAYLNRGLQDNFVKGTLFFTDQQGDQALAFDLLADDDRWSLTLKSDYYPMRSFFGRGLVAGQKRAYYDTAGGWLPLAFFPRQRFEPQAELITEIFDGHEAACIWHRLLIDGCIPPGTSVQIAARATEYRDLLEQLPWQLQPDPYLRHDGPEIPYFDLFSKEEKKRPGVGTWELLFQGLKGRYIQIRLNMTSSGQKSPRLSAVRVYYPRFSFAKAYLPTAYGQDEPSADFLDRFLANVEGMFSTLEGRIAEAQMLFSPESVPSAYTNWLLNWFGLSLDEGWDETRKRLYLRHAMTLFNQRGTVQGLIRLLRLATSPCPDDSIVTDPVQNTVGFDIRIIERFRTRKIAAVEVGDSSEESDDENSEETAHRFSVLIPTAGETDEARLAKKLNLVRRIVDQEKPAHTVADVRTYFALFRVGDARLGFDSLLTASQRVRTLVVGKSAVAEGVVGIEFPAVLTHRLSIGKGAGLPRTL